MKNWKLALLFAAMPLAFAPGCDDAADADKGVEEEALSADGKEDSFFRPTERGALAFAVPNAGTFSADARFHAWQFELTDDAKVTLTTAINTANLDTVMYLYTREDSNQSWGRYIAKNDDHQGNIWSQIEDNLDKGEYRVIVKAFKKAMTGSFTINGVCDGPGCPTAVDCDADKVAEIPGETDFDAACTAKVLAVLETPVTNSNSRTFTPFQDKCSFPANEILFGDHYASYWSDYGYGDLLDTYGWTVDDKEDFEIYLSVHQHGDAGFTVHSDVGADEDGLTFIYDADLNPLTAYWHNQSPIANVFCGEGGEEHKMHEDCLSQLMWLAEEVKADGNRESGTVETGLSINDADDLRVFAALEQFAADHNLGDGEEVTWSRNGGLRLTLEAGSLSTDYVVGDNYVFMVIQDGKAETICKNLE